ncbi:SulP family inorganic anion transporter [Pelomicrobium methylotrophicum]|uniref:STAS domain-containing protein n=1 Tax=Pelomicrobium methylotrophicum TaxID=2602750 RepID=A0A5C7EL23_9PROT|nr:SulP family inorganic anion transporter [Pelomicrobium methylotrophicum]TXF12210.1 STAS domain-containing protein [Pelomicrobium methylotrophicum]
MNACSLTRFFPFLAWFPVKAATLRADLTAGITVGLVLVPQSLAYAQLAGLPPYYGLYAAFVPVIVAAAFGSSHQLATGPVAMVSLLTGAVLAPLAAAGSEQFVALAILLALMVGVLQLLMGVFRLGVLVNFLSHPVIVGFTNAAAFIIAASQFNKLIGVSKGRSESFLLDMWGVLLQLGDIHWPTLAMGAGAIGLMVTLKKIAPRAPGVLVAVIIATAVSWATGFEKKGTALPDQIADDALRSIAVDYVAAQNAIAELQHRIQTGLAELHRAERSGVLGSRHVVALRYHVEILRLELADLENENRKRMRDLRKFAFERAMTSEGPRLYLHGQLPEGFTGDGQLWRIRAISDGKLQLAGGGEVVGTIPPGLPEFKLPSVNLEKIGALLSGALIIALVGFMEAVSAAKAIATRTRQRLDANQELIGQGLANVAGSLFQSFPVSGSFSRTAVNYSAGARTGMASLFTAFMVVITLLLFTPLLYHLPQAVLAAIIMMAVAGLINFRAMRDAWRAHRHDGIAALVTFAATLVFAPHLDKGILLGAGLAVVLYLYRTMKPRVVVLGRHPDGVLRDADLHGLPLSEHLVAVRFDGQLYFANTPYFEAAILDVAARFPKARQILVVADGINQMDASGEEAVRHLNARLREAGVTLSFSGLKRQVLEVMERTGLIEKIGRDNLFAREDDALEALAKRIDDPDFDPRVCPLLHRQDPRSASS